MNALPTPHRFATPTSLPQPKPNNAASRAAPRRCRTSRIPVRRPQKTPSGILWTKQSTSSCGNGGDVVAALA